MKELNNPDKAKAAKGPELRIIDIDEVVGWDRNIRLCLELSAAEWAWLGAAKRHEIIAAVDAAHAYLSAHFNNDPNFEIAFLSETGSDTEFDLVGYDLRRIWQAAKAAQKRLSEWSNVDPQTAKRQAEVSDLVCPLYELVKQFTTERNVDWQITLDVLASLNNLLSNGIAPGTSPTDRILSPPDRSSQGVTGVGKRSTGVPAMSVLRVQQPFRTSVFPRSRGPPSLQTKWPAGI